MKILAYILEFAHNIYISGIIIGIVWLSIKALFYNIYNVFSILMLNIGLLFAYLLFTYLRTCIFFLFFNRSLGFHDCGEYYSIVDVFRGQPIVRQTEFDCEKNLNKWYTGIRILTMFITLLDVMYIDHFWKSEAMYV